MNHLFNKKYGFDVFISYREDTSKNSRELAETIAKAYQSIGYKVFFDQWFIGKVTWRQAIEKSRNYVVLLTDYSFDKNNKSYDKNQHSTELAEFTSKLALTEYLKNILNYDESSDGNVFKKEVITICEKIFDEWREHKGKDIDEVTKKVRFLNINKEFPTKESDFKLEVEAFLKKSFWLTSFHPKEIIPVQKNGFVKYAEGFKELPMVKWRRLCKKWSTWLTIFALVATAALVCCGVLLVQYSRPGILFAGGGTTTHYIAHEIGVDVKYYAPNSRYVHLPSTSAYDLLWDEANDSSSYYPIVLSAGEMDASELDGTRKKRFCDRYKKILQYFLDSVNLIVQLRNYKGTEYSNGGFITVSKLSQLLGDTTIIKFATSESSGTYNEYAKFLPGLHKDGNYKVFTPEDYDVGEKATQVYLANEYYKIKKDNRVVEMRICDDSTGCIKKLPLYVYAVGTNDRKNNYLPIGPVNKFIKKLKLDIEEGAYYSKDVNGIIIKVNKSKYH